MKSKRMSKAKPPNPPTQPPKAYNPRLLVDRSNHVLKVIKSAAEADDPLSPLEIGVYRHIAHRDGGDGKGCYESMPKLCLYTGYARHAVGRAIRKLANRRLIRLEPRARTYTLYFVHPVTLRLVK